MRYVVAEFDQNKFTRKLLTILSSGHLRPVHKLKSADGARDLVQSPRGIVSTLSACALSNSAQNLRVSAVRHLRRADAPMIGRAEASLLMPAL